MKPIGQDSSLNISLPMLFQAVAVIAMQNLPIPSDVRQDEKIQRIEKEIIRLRDGKRN